MGYLIQDYGVCRIQVTGNVGCDCTWDTRFQIDFYNETIIYLASRNVLSE